MWDDVQREILAALGHEPLVLAPMPELSRALLRAAARTPDSSDVAEVLRVLPPASALRGDAAAKRALWPRLRRLRGVR